MAENNSRIPSFVLAALLLASSAFGQENSAQAPSAPPTVLRASTQLVVVDVSVLDGYGRPVHGLKKDDFKVMESKAPQTLRVFEEHGDTERKDAPLKMPPMPPGTFTDYAPVAPGYPLNILLLDTLNTPMTDQVYVRDQLRRYVEKAPQGVPIAIFGLGTRLTILQGFSSDPRILKDAVEHKFNSRSSPLLGDPVGTHAGDQKTSDQIQELADTNPDVAPQLAVVAANLRQFEADNAAQQTGLRVQYTLNAFNQLAHFLSTYPGRKNLLWFSGSFPLSIMPDDSLTNPFSVTSNFFDEYRETSSLLGKAQVAVYPIDGRGLMVDPTFTAANSSHVDPRRPTQVLQSTKKFYESQANEHMTMQQMAADTGGQAFYNRNDLATAASEAIQAGTNYYTLTYSPTDRNWDGKFRPIHVELTDAASKRGYKLSYRRGYYALDHTPGNAPGSRSSSQDPVLAANTDKTSQAYLQASLSRGAPTPSEILFKVRVLPASTTTEDSVVPENHAAATLKGPYRRYVIDFAALASNIAWNAKPNGEREGKAIFEVLVFDADGHLLNNASIGRQFLIKPEKFGALMQSIIDAHLEVSVPAKGESYIRAAVHDTASGRIGVVEIPTSMVSKLAPPSPPTAK